MVQCRADGDKVVEPILKYVLMMFNFFSFAVGILFIIGGAYLLYYRDTAADNFQDVYNIATDLGGYLCAVGVITVFLSLVAIAATIRENCFVLRLYMTILILIMVINLVIGVVMLIYSGKITTAISNKLRGNYITQYQNDDSIKVVFDTLQSQYQCCGILDYKDWNFNSYYNCNTTASALACQVPATCCIGYLSQQKTINMQCSGNVGDSTSTIYTSGCAKAIFQIAEYAVKLIASILIGVTIVLLINIILVQYLTILIRKEMALYNAKKLYSQLNDDDEESAGYLN